MAGVVVQEPTHQELCTSSIKHSEEAVQRVLAHLQSWSNPFVPSEALVSLSSEVQVRPNVAADLLDAHKTGKAAMKSFFQKCLIGDEFGFFDRLTALKLKTFNSLLKVARVSEGGAQAVIHADRSLFARLAVVAQNRDLDMRDVLSYEFGLLPWSIATPDGDW